MTEKALGALEALIVFLTSLVPLGLIAWRSRRRGQPP